MTLRIRFSLAVAMLVIVSSTARSELVNIIGLPSTQHEYTGGGSNPEYSIDEDHGTSWHHELWGFNSSQNINLVGEHTFANPTIIEELVWHASANAWAGGETNIGGQARGRLEYSPDGIDWFVVAGTEFNSGGNMDSGSGNWSDARNDTFFLSSLGPIKALRGSVYPAAYANSPPGENRSGIGADMSEIQAWVTAVPEPSTLVGLASMAIVGLLLARPRRRSRM